MNLSFGQHLEMSLKNLNRYNAFSDVVRDNSHGVAIKEEQRDSEGPVPIKRLLPMITAFGQWLGPGALLQLCPDRL